MRIKSLRGLSIGVAKQALLHEILEKVADGTYIGKREGY